MCIYVERERERDLYIDIYACVYICVYIYMYISIYIHINKYIYIYIYIYMGADGFPPCVLSHDMILCEFHMVLYVLADGSITSELLMRSLRLSSNILKKLQILKASLRISVSMFKH